MVYAAPILTALFLAITFLTSGYEKVMDWKGNIAWLKEHFAQTILKNRVPLALLHVLILELISGILCLAGSIQLYTNHEKVFALYGGIFSCITLIMLLFGQRLAKDYDGARTIVIYFVPAVLLVYWLS